MGETKVLLPNHMRVYFPPFCKNCDRVDPEIVDGIIEFDDFFGEDTRCGNYILQCKHKNACAETLIRINKWDFEEDDDD